MSEEEFSEVSELETDSWIELGQGNFDAAISLTTQAIKLAPNVATLYHLRARALQANKNYKKAIVDITKAIELDQSIKYFRTRAEIYRTLDMFEAAIEDLSVVISMGGDDMDYIQRGINFELKKKYSEALADFARISKESSNYSIAQLKIRAVMEMIKGT